jgi:hypothetical protein
MPITHTGSSLPIIPSGIRPSSAHIEAKSFNVSWLAAKSGTSVGPDRPSRQNIRITERMGLSSTHGLPDAPINWVADFAKGLCNETLRYTLACWPSLSGVRERGHPFLARPTKGPLMWKDSKASRRIGFCNNGDNHPSITHFQSPQVRRT